MDIKRQPQGGSDWAATSARLPSLEMNQLAPAIYIILFIFPNNYRIPILRKNGCMKNGEKMQKSFLKEEKIREWRETFSCLVMHSGSLLK